MFKHGIGRSLAGALLLSVLTACGGGGGGSGGGSSSGGGGGVSSSSGGGSSGLSMSLSASSVSVTASTSGAAPTASVEVILNQVPTTSLYIGYNNTSNGISSLSFSAVNSTTENVTINFDSPAQLGAGTYSDTVTLAVCYDQECESQIANSPQTVQVQYIVTGASSGSSSGGASSSSSGGSSGGAAVLALSSVSPSYVTVGGTAFTLTAIGTGFNAGSTVQWNGGALATTYVSSTQLTAQVPASDIATAGSAAVTVVNTSAPTGTSAAQTVNITAASIDATSFLINPAHTGAITFNSVTFPTAASWSVTLDGPPSYALIADGLVYVTVNASSGTSELLALNPATGATVWGPVALSGIANAAYDNGTVFAISENIGDAALMQAFDASTGAEKWSAVLSGQYDFSSAPTALDGVVYTVGAGEGGTLYALNENNGATAWTEGVNNGDSSTPAVTADGVYVAFPCWTYDFNPATGGSVWNNDTGCDGGGGGTPVVANGTLYAPNGFGTYNGDTFNAETGALLGEYSADNPPALTGTTGYFLQSGTLRGITLSSNTILWSFAGDGALVTSPIAVNQYVIVGSSNGNLYALNGSTGQQVWTQKLSAAIPSGAGWGANIPLSALAAGDGLLVVPAGNTLTAYNLSASP